MWAVAGVALFLRLFQLGRDDVISDEALYGFRSIGLMDFDFALAQPSTWQMLDPNIPWWAYLSFHDHPPLVFLIQHVFLLIGGANVWALRLSSALFGFGIVALVYLLARRLLSRTFAFVAAGIVALNALMLYISRVAVQEAYVLFFLLLSVYWFVRARDNARWYTASGTAFGLALLSKYTALFFLPAFVVALLMRRLPRQSWTYVLLGAAAALVLFSPVIVYNILLYRTLGHFDFQFSYVFGQDVSYWQVAPGKEIGSMWDRLQGIVGNLWVFTSRWFAVGSAVAAATVAWKGRRKEGRSEAWWLIVLFAGCAFASYAVIGPAPRFLAMAMPWLALIMASAGNVLWKRFASGKVRLAIGAALVGLFVLEGAYAVNTWLIDTPRGIDGVHFSRIRWDAYPWGFQGVDAFIQEQWEGKYPIVQIPYSLSFVADIQQKAWKRRKGNSPSGALFVYNENMSDLGALWHIIRWSVYEGIPIISVSRWLSFSDDPVAWFKEKGASEIYLIQPTENTLLLPPSRRTADEEKLESILAQGELVRTIDNAQGEHSFSIYRW